MKDKMMICPKAKECKVKEKYGCKHNKPHAEIIHPSDACKETCFNGLTCIPYEPEPIGLTLAQQFLSSSKDIEIPILGIHIKKQEPQPATCPDCGHPVHEGIHCPEKVSIMQYCGCDKRTPADLQPEKQCPEFHCTLPDYRSCPRKESGTFDCFDKNCGYWKDKTSVKPEKPTQMPLDDAICNIFSNYADELSEELREKIGMQISTAVTVRQQAHDSAIRREFAEKVIERWNWPSFDAFAAEVRAMAEGKE